MPLRLTVFVSGRPGEVHVLSDGDTFVLGRRAPADVLVDDARVSREHARFTFVGGAWRVADLHSKNGVRLDGRPVAGAVLSGQAWLSIGGVPVRAEVVSAADAVPAVPSTTDAGLGGGTRPAELVETVLDAVRRVAECERAGIWLRADDAADPLAVVGAHASPPSVGTIRAVMRSRQPVFCSDTDGAAALARRDSVVAGGIRALVAVPAGSDAVVYADSTRPGKLFTRADATLIEGLASQLAVIVAARRVRDDLDRIAHSR